MTDRLSAYKAVCEKMHRHTAENCAQNPHCRYQCCSPAQCEWVVKFAKEHFGIDLEIKGDGTLCGFKGCTVKPHLRPICTVHDCDIASDGFSKDKEWTRKYFKLRARMDTELEKLIYLISE